MEPVTAPPTRNPGREIKKKIWTMTFVRGCREPENKEAASVGWGLGGGTAVDPWKGLL